MASLLPYVEQGPLYNQLDRTQPWNKGVNERAAKSRIPMFLNPAIPEGAADEPAKTHYVGIAGVGKDGPTLPVTSPKAGVFAYNRTARFADILDGTSNTLMVTEATAQSAGPWARGGEATIRALTTKPYVNGPDGIGGPLPGRLQRGTRRRFGAVHLREDRSQSPRGPLDDQRERRSGGLEEITLHLQASLPSR